LRERDENKDDAITMLSGQLITITERLKELERKQQQPQNKDNNRIKISLKREM
jgi:hypothetical protein